jgi:hypothetical protein
MTPQAILKARFSELAEACGVVLISRRQGGKFYFTITGELKATAQFLQGSFPTAWMTSCAGPEAVYGLPLAEAQKVIATCQCDPAWLQNNNSAALRLAQEIRDKASFDVLPVLADALQEAGCDNAEILSHCRAAGTHKHCCWVIELLLGPDRKRRRQAAST